MVFNDERRRHFLRIFKAIPNHPTQLKSIFICILCACKVIEVKHRDLRVYKPIYYYQYYNNNNTILRASSSVVGAFLIVHGVGQIIKQLHHRFVRKLSSRFANTISTTTKHASASICPTHQLNSAHLLLLILIRSLRLSLSPVHELCAIY